jgi:hypothetical protein
MIMLDKASYTLALRKLALERELNEDRFPLTEAFLNFSLSDITHSVYIYIYSQS